MPRDRDDDRRGRDYDDEPRRSRRDDYDDRDDDRRSSRSRERDDDRDDDRGRGRDRDDDRRSSRGGSFQYHERDPKAMKARAEQQGGLYDSIFKSGFPTWRPEVGDNEIRILPPSWTEPEPDHYGLDVYIHRNIGPDKSTYLCPLKMGKGPCPICEEMPALDPDDASAIKPARTPIVWMIDRAQEKEGPKLWQMSWTMDKDIASRALDKRTGRALLIDHPDKGYDVSFIREGTGMKNTRYLRMEIARDPSPLHDNPTRQDEWLNYIQENPIPDVLNFFDYEYLKKVFAGRVHHEDRDLDDDRDERRSRGRDEGRSRRDRDDDSGRRSSRADDDERPSRRGRSRDDDEDPRDRAARAARGRGDEEEIPSRRSRRDAEDDDSPSRGRSRDDDKGETSDRPRLRNRGRDEDTPTRSRLRDMDKEADDAAGRDRDDDDRPRRGRR